MFAMTIMTESTPKPKGLQAKRDRLRDELEALTDPASGAGHRESSRRLMLELNRAELLLQASARKPAASAPAKPPPVRDGE